MHAHSSRGSTFFPRQVAFILVVLLIGAGCSLPGLLFSGQGSETGTATGVPPMQGSSGLQAPAVLGFVLDPDGAPVAYASVENEVTAANGAVSGDLTGGTGGWIEIKSPGYATGYARPEPFIGSTALFEARLTPFQVFQPLDAGQELALTLGDAARPVAELSLKAEDLSALPAFIEAAVYDRYDVGPYLAKLSSGEDMDLKLALAVEAMSGQGEAASLAPGKSLTLKFVPDPGLPADAVMAIFDPGTGQWETQPGACTPDEAGALNCSLSRLAPLVGLFGPRQASSSLRPPGLSQVREQAAAHSRETLQDPTGDDQAYQNAKADFEEWARLGQEQMNSTGSTSPEWEAEKSARLGRLADAADLYATQHPGDPSGTVRLLKAAEYAAGFGEQELADKLLNQARAALEAQADALLSEGDCGRLHEMLLVAQQLMLLGSTAKADALIAKAQAIRECDEWVGHINVWMTLTHSNPGLDAFSRESGPSTWHELHLVHILTDVQTYALRGEDRVTLKFGEVRYGKTDRHNCHNYLTHGADSGGNIYLKFDGRYDGYTFTVGDLQPEGGTAVITYGAHFENWDDKKDECVEVQDTTLPAPNYSSILVHGMTGSPPITMHEMLQSGNQYSLFGQQNITNEAFDQGIHPWQTGIIIWNFEHTQKHLPLK